MNRFHEKRIEGTCLNVLQVYSNICWYNVFSAESRLDVIRVLPISQAGNGVESIGHATNDIVLVLLGLLHVGMLQEHLHEVW